MLVFNSGLWDGSSNSKCGTCSSLGSSQVCLVLMARGWKGGRYGRNAYAVCFAYCRSLVKTIADEKTITIMRSALQRKTCIRFSVLENIGIKGSSGKWTKLHWQWWMTSSFEHNTKCVSLKYKILANAYNLFTQLTYLILWKKQTY